MKKMALIHTGIRLDEKLIIEASQKRNIQIELINLNSINLDAQKIDYWFQFDCILERSISTVRGNAAIEFFSNLDIKIVNNKQISNLHIIIKIQSSTS